jgi:hypothetical protein
LPLAAGASAEPSDMPAASGKEGRVAARRAVQVGSPEALAAARAEPGIHPSQFVEVKGDGEDEDVMPPGSPASPAPPAPNSKGTQKGKPDPAEEEDDDK